MFADLIYMLFGENTVAVTRQKKNDKGDYVEREICFSTSLDWLEANYCHASDPEKMIASIKLERCQCTKCKPALNRLKKIEEIYQALISSKYQPAEIGKGEKICLDRDFFINPGDLLYLFSWFDDLALQPSFKKKKK